MPFAPLIFGVSRRISQARCSARMRILPALKTRQPRKPISSREVGTSTWWFGTTDVDSWIGVPGAHSDRPKSSCHRANW